MRVLALDTTTRAGSVAVVDDDRVVFEELGDPLRSQAERLPADLVRGVAAAGLTWDAIDLFAVASGPGSFTGLRIGIATMQGLALVMGKRMVPVSALAASAYGAATEMPAGAVVGSWLDAHRREIFSALYRVREAPRFAIDRLEEIEGARVGDPAVTWHRWRSAIRPAVIVGEGAVLYAETFGAAMSDATPDATSAAPAGDDVRIAAPRLLAPIIGRMAIAHARRGDSVHPAAVQPLYVRRPDVELARDAALDGHRH